MDLTNLFAVRKPYLSIDPKGDHSGKMKNEIKIKKNDTFRCNETNSDRAKEWDNFGLSISFKKLDF